jgi:hypothetical protein
MEKNPTWRKSMSKKQSLVTFLVVLSWTVIAAAAPITYIYTGTGSGSIGGTPFTDAAFSITGVGETADLASCGGGCQEINHTATSVTISGIGTFQITSPLRTFLNNTPGLSRQNPPGGDLYNLYVGDFTGWDLVSDWGPINTTGSIHQWASPQVNTSGGILVFTDNGTTPGTFQSVLGQEAAAIPTLSQWGMVLLACLLLCVAIRRIRRFEGVVATR